jgi:hypothetical protein
MPRSYRVYLIGFFLAVIYSVPLAQTAAEIVRGERPHFLDVFRESPTAANLRAFEHELERSSVVAASVRPATQYFWYATLRNPGEKAVAGREGWFFYKPDVRYLVEPLDNTGPLSAILAFRRQLAARGIHLMVMPVPGKPSVYPDRLSRRACTTDGPGLSHTSELIARLRAAGVETIDILEAIERWRKEDGGAAEPYYLMRDTHWSGRTARRVAELVAAEIRMRGWIGEGSTEYVTRAVRIRRRGDVIRMMEAPEVDGSFPPEQVPCEQVLSKSTGALYKDDPGSPVLVLGDSFSRMYQTDEPTAAGFIAHLARELHTPLASIVNDGGASTLVRQQLARRAGLLRGKKLVIWEFVERDIRFGADGWQAVPLPE